MDNFKLPQQLDLHGSNPAEAWKRWKQRFELFMLAKEAHKKDDKIKIAMLLSAIGEDGLQRFNYFTWRTEGDDPEKKDKYDHVMNKFDKEFAGMKRVVFSRFQFWDYCRPEGQTFDEYLVELRRRADKCEFLESDNMIRDKIIFSLTDKALQEKLLAEENVTLSNTIDMCRSKEVTKKEMQSMTKQKYEGDKQIHFLKKGKSKPMTRQKVGQSKYSPVEGATGYSGREKKSCKRCGKTHGYKECPAWGRRCNRCQGMNHFGNMCRSKTVPPAKNKTVNELNYDTSSSDEYFVGTIDVSSVRMKNEINDTDDSNAWFSVINVEGSCVKMKLDTGAATNIMPLKTFKKLNPSSSLQKSSANLRAYGGHVVEHVGKCMLECTSGDKTDQFEFYVVDAKAPPILGLKACCSLGLIQKATTHDEKTVPVHSVYMPLTKETVLKEYGEIFEGLGKFSTQYHIQVKPEIKPVIQPPHRVPASLKDRLKIKLDKMVEQNVIANVDGPTEWVGNIVVVEKKDKDLRICLDPKWLNSAIKREHFQIPTVDDVLSSIGGKKLFTVIDLKEAYWQVELSDESSYLTTFNTPFGRYRFLRMPFGLCSASEVLQKRAYQTFGDIPNVHIVADDIIIAGNTHEECDKILHTVFKRAHDQNIKFNWKKIQFKQHEVKYMGNVISADGMKPDEIKVKAIADMPTPECKQDVQRLIGMLNYLSPYIPDMSTETSPIRSLLKNDVPFQWQPEHTNALNRIKAILTSDPVLRLYDMDKPLKIQADASSTGLGACLMQEGRPIAYASRSLTPTEQRWFQIEKELLAIVFAAERFNQYIYGKEIEVESDHKPLETILRKPIQNASPRIQLMLLRLLRYNLCVTYVPGSKLFIADALSRAYTDVIPHTGDSQIKEMEMRVHSVVLHLPVSHKRRLELLQATAND